MAERDPQAREQAGGGMTGETGSVTAGEDDPFVPGELREVADPELENEITTQQREEADERHARESGDMGRGAPGSMAGPLQAERASGLTGQQGDASMTFGTTPSAGTAAGAGATNLAEREGGYGSSHGLSQDDPAYRMELHETGPRRTTGAGGDPPREPRHEAEDDEGRENRAGGDDFSSAEEHF